VVLRSKSHHQEASGADCETPTLQDTHIASSVLTGLGQSCEDLRLYGHGVHTNAPRCRRYDGGHSVDIKRLALRATGDLGRCGDLSTSKMGVLAAGVLRIWRFELDGKQAHVAAGAKPRPPYSPSLSKGAVVRVNSS